MVAHKFNCIFDENANLTQNLSTQCVERFSLCTDEESEVLRSAKRSNPVNECGGIRTGLLKVCL